MNALSEQVETLRPHTAVPYEYYDLPPGYFRYLVLEPGTKDAPLKCTLQTVLLDGAGFEAISYVWGSEIKDQEIICDEYIINITTNLSLALKRLRLPDKARELWADSICINQDNLVEKGHQVAIMSDIYREAQQVLICLGDEDYGLAARVCSLLEDVNTLIEHELNRLEVWDWDSFPYPADDEPLLDDTRWEVFPNMLLQPWFRRGWVVREAANASRCVIIWANYALNWEKIMRAWTWLTCRTDLTFGKADIFLHANLHVQCHQDNHEALYRLFVVEDDWFWPTLLERLNFGRNLRVSDPRDRIFAFLHLLPGSTSGLSFEPNYEETFLETYHRFAVQYIRSTSDIHLLDYISHNSAGPQSGTPSWVPRWDNSPSRFTSTGLNTEPLRSRFELYPSIDISGLGTLRVQAIMHGHVQWVSEVLENETMDLAAVSKIWLSMSELRIDSPYGETYRLQAFLQALCAGRYSGDYQQLGRSRDAYALHLLKICTSEEGKTQRHRSTNIDNTTALFTSQIKWWAHNSRLAINDRGYLGLVPNCVSEGDLCAIIPGCVASCILRRVEDKQCYQHLGPSFFMGKRNERDEYDRVMFGHLLGSERSKDWVDWDVEEEEICLV
ncbi:hypothetical protein ACN47E_003378 [Coniothyrium glycines]